MCIQNFKFIYIKVKLTQSQSDFTLADKKHEQNPTADNTIMQQVDPHLGPPVSHSPSKPGVTNAVISCLSCEPRFGMPNT